MNLVQQLRQPRSWAPALTFVVGVVIASVTSTELHRAEREQADMQLSTVVDGFGALLQMHLAGCEEALRAASMVASADPHLDAQQWLAVGRQVRVGEFNACAESMVYLGAPATASLSGPQPAGDGKTTTKRRTLIAPEGGDLQRLAAFDPWLDPLHRAAMEEARDQGKPRLTARVTWPGVAREVPVVVWYMPVYRRSAALDTPPARAEALIGFVAIPIRVDGVVEALAQQLPNAHLALECHSGASDLFDLPLSASTNASASTIPEGAGDQVRERTLRIGGRWWTLHAGLVAAAGGPLDNLSPSAISLATGLVLSALLAWLAWLMLTQSARAYALAHRFSRDARDREARLRSVLDGTRDGILTLDVEGRIQAANHAVQEMLGYTEADLLAHRMTFLLSPERTDARHDAWQDLLRSARQRDDGHGPVQEIELPHRDGRMLHVRSSLSLVRTEIHEFVVWVVSDLTREREMERRAQEVAALNQAIMDVAPIGVMTIGADSTIATANRASHVMHGYDAGDLVGQPADILVDPDEIAARAIGCGVLAGDLRPVHGSVAADGALAETEWTYVRKDGTRFPAGVIALPLHDAAGRSLGGLRMVLDITERKRAAAKIEHMALHDSLTGLPNRVLLNDRAEQVLARARRHAGRFAYLLLDLDRFKQINDTLGHAIGDEVLKVVSQRLTDAVRASDTVVRMGGDEFALLLPEVAGAEQAVEVADKILAAMTKDLLIDGKRLHVTASIGIALYPMHGSDLPTLLKNADAAMYDAKARGRDAASLYNEQMSGLTSDHLEREADLRRALDHGELVLHYQPLVDATNGQVHTLEALLRWQHPDRGLVPPGEFIPLAEESGLIVPIGAWVLRQACADLARLRGQGHPRLRMAVNLSARQFMAETLEETVDAALRAVGLTGAALELEITESVLMISLERTRKILNRLRATGVGIAIDDFGTGYSSLSYLAHFPVQILKVDRSFVQQIEIGEGTALLIAAIVAMAHSLGLKVVAEGVETVHQHRHLVELGCEYLQGFRFSKAIPIESVSEVIARVETMRGLPPDRRAA